MCDRVKYLSGIVLSLLTLIGAISILTWPVSAQTSYGTILGTVRDPTGAVAPGATITVKNVSTGMSSTAVADESGNYYVSSLPVGTYEVTAELKGFKKEIVSDLVLEVEKKARVDFTLTVGSASQSIEVRAAPPLVDTDSSTVGTVVENKAIVEMPLDGRDFLQLATLTPTVRQSSGLIGQPNASLLPGILIGSENSIGGARVGGNGVLLDGIDVTEPNTNAPVVQPNPDEIQEFKIQTTTMNAEFGPAAIMNVVTKSGTNNFRGDAYEFLRNDIFDANDFFSNAAGLHKAPLRFNQFGGGAGGPLVLPRVYDGRNKTFFFGSYEGFRIRSPGTIVANLPSPDFLAGNFSALGQPIIDPSTGMPFPRNMIPTTRISKFASGFIPFIPAPNLPPGKIPGSNFALGVSDPSHYNSFTGRVDQAIAKGLVFGRYTFQRGGARILGLTDLWDLLTTTGEQNAVIGVNYAFSPKMVNETRFAYNRISIKVGSTPANGNINYAGDVLGLKNLSVSKGLFTFPLVVLSGFRGMGNPFLGSTLTQNSNTYTFLDTITNIRGNHAIKGGFNIRRVQFTLGAGQIQNGFFIFAGSFTNSSVADFLLGDPLTAIAGIGSNGDFALSTEYSAFVQDDWKVTSRLTLNYGVRYEHSSPPVMDNNQQAILDPNFPGGRILIANSPNYVIPGTGLIKGSGPALVSRGLFSPDYNDFGPRFGFAFSPFNNNKTSIRGGYGIFYDRPIENEHSLSRYSPPFFFQETLVSSPTTPQLSTDTLFPVPTTFPGGGSGSVSTTQRTPYLQQWSLDVQRELAPNLLFEVGYLGAKGTNLQEREPFNQAVLGPGPITSRVPLANFTSAFILSDNVASSNYNAAIIKIERRFSGGLGLIASYTYGKLIDTITGTVGPLAATTSAQNERCLACDRAPSDLDVRHRLVTSYTYQLPFGRNRKFLSNVSGPLDQIIGGWEVSGITSFQSGSPVNVTTPGDNANVGAGAQRPDVVKSVSKMDFRKTGFAFDTSTFVLPPAGQFGNAGRNIVPGPGIDNFDFAVHKNFYFNEERNRFLQFRFETFNLFNHAQFTPPGNVFGTPGFGRFTGTRAPRVIQVALKIGF